MIVLYVCFTINFSFYCSNALLFILLKGRKKNLPEIVLTLPKKIKTKTSIFSALTEGEASDLAIGLTKSLCQNVSPELVRKEISDLSAEATRYSTFA